MRKIQQILSFLVLLPLFFHSQDGPVVVDNKPIVVSAHIGIPKTITSNKFRNSFNGFYEGDVSINFKLVNNFYAGIGYKRTDLQNNKFLKQKVFNASIPYNTHFISDCPFVKLSFDKFFKENAYINYSIQYGYMIAKFTDVNEDTTSANKPYGKTNFNSHYIEPHISANFIVDKTMSSPLVFSVFLGYTTLFYKFDPKAPRFNQFEQELGDKSNNYFMSWITFGFGINVLIGKNK